MTASYSSGMLHLENPAQVTEGRKVVVDYVDEDRIETTMKLPFENARDIKAILVANDGSKHPCDSSEIEFNNGELTINCPLIDIKQIVASYRVEQQGPTSFTLDDVRNPDQSIWKVYLNGEDLQNFQRSGNKISFSTPLPGNSTLKIVVSASN